MKVAEAIAAACLTFALCCFPAFAQELTQPPQASPPEQSKFAWGVENDFRSSHVWRGLVISDQPVLQPEAWISVSGFTLDAWSNLTLRDTTERTRPRIMELSLQYERDWGKLRIEPTLEADFYRDPLNVESSKWVENSLRMSYPAGPLRVFTSQGFEVSYYRGAYFGEAGIEYERRLPKNTELEITPSLGWASAKFNEANIGVPKAAFNLVAVESSLTHYVNRNLYLRPELGFSRIMNAQLRAAVLHPTFLTFGLTIGVAFPNAHRAP
ncbi:MAG TPA: hypothetical protein VI431_05770 [Candidatus Acidoferrum sp.]